MSIICEGCEQEVDYLCPACEDKCVNCCPLSGDVCEGCGGHLEGEETARPQFCEECACITCGSLFTTENQYVDERMCTNCTKETEEESEEPKADATKKRKVDEEK